jgi:asparagine synthase (glutamine-hydrolysing)
MDVPLRFAASIPLFAVSQLARESVKVVLAGEGSDELFGGYGRYSRGMLNLQAGAIHAQLVPEGVRAAIRRRVLRGGNGRLASRLKRSFLGRLPGVVDTYLEAFSVFDEEHRAALLPALTGVDAQAAERVILDTALLGVNPLEAILRFDQETYLEELLTKQDKMSMAASIESRVPFLDQAMLAWARELPAVTKVRWGQGKRLVREAARGRVPPLVLRGPKRGFLVPLGEWFRGFGRGWIEEYGPRDGNGLLEPRYVRRLVSEHASGVDHTERLWLILAFQVWQDLAITRAVPAKGWVLTGLIS